jgi:hypothetical protein
MMASSVISITTARGWMPNTAKAALACRVGVKAAAAHAEERGVRSAVAAELLAGCKACRRCLSL